MNKLMVGLGLLGAVMTAQAAEIGWEKSYSEALAKAKSSNRLVMVDFYTDW